MVRVGMAALLLLLGGCASQPSASQVIPGSCPAEVATAAMETIWSQQRAFADSDFAKARSYASSSFQSTIDVAQFTEIIQTRYGFLLTDPELAFTNCDLLRGVAQMSVRVKTTPEQLMTYRVIQEGDVWRVDGATTRESSEVTA